MEELSCQMILPSHEDGYLAKYPDKPRFVSILLNIHNPDTSRGNDLTNTILSIQQFVAVELIFMKATAGDCISHKGTNKVQMLRL